MIRMENTGRASAGTQQYQNQIDQDTSMTRCHDRGREVVNLVDIYSPDCRGIGLHYWQHIRNRRLIQTELFEPI